MAISTSTFTKICALTPKMAISTSSAFTSPTTASTASISMISRRRLFTAAGAAISASAASSTTKPQHHQSILEKLHLKSPPPPSTVDGQTLSVYEFNEGDRRSPAFLKLSKAPEKSLGDIATFTNKLYSGDLATRLGITAGMIMYIEKDESGGDRYEAVYSFYFGKFGHVSIQGAYFSDVDSELAVTGGTGVFEGARGKVKLLNVAYPFKLFYTFELSGIGKLPEELVGGEVVKPSPAAKPLTATKASSSQ